MEHPNTSSKQTEQLKNLAANTIMLVDRLKVEKDSFQLEKIAIDLLRSPCLLIKDLHPEIWRRIKGKTLEDLLPENLDISTDVFDSVILIFPDLIF